MRGAIELQKCLPSVYLAVQWILIMAVGVTLHADVSKSYFISLSKSCRFPDNRDGSFVLLDKAYLDLHVLILSRAFPSFIWTFIVAIHMLVILQAIIWIEQKRTQITPATTHRYEKIKPILLHDVDRADELFFSPLLSAYIEMMLFSSFYLVRVTLCWDIFICVIETSTNYLTRDDFTYTVDLF